MTRIVSSADERIGEVEEIQRIFPPEERDPVGFLGEVLRDDDDPVPNTPDSQMVLLVYERNGHIHGYLSAEYVPSTRTIFLWYLVDLRTVNERSIRWGVPPELEATAAAQRRSERDYALSLVGQMKKRTYDRKVATTLIRKLSRTCDRIAGPWEHLIAEVDTAHPTEARAKLVSFQRFGREILALPQWWRKLNKMLGRTLREEDRVFIVDTPFKMPLHEPRHLGDGDLSTHESDGWLVYAPRPKRRKGKDGAAPTLSHGQLVRLFDTLATSYKRSGEPEYNAYIDAFFEQRKLEAKTPVQLLLRD